MESSILDLLWDSVENLKRFGEDFSVLRGTSSHEWAGHSDLFGVLTETQSYSISRLQRPRTNSDLDPFFRLENHQREEPQQASVGSHKPRYQGTELTTGWIHRIEKRLRNHQCDEGQPAD